MTRKMMIIITLMSIALALLAVGTVVSRRIPVTESAAERPPEPQATVEEDSIELPVRGVWDDNVYTNEYLGFRFVMPSGWVASTDYEIADMMGMVYDLLAAEGDELAEELWKTAGLTTIHEMMVTNVYTGANIQIAYERIISPYADLSALEYLEIMSMQIEDIGLVVDINPSGMTRIGAHEWYSLETVMETSGRNLSVSQLINILDGFVRIVTITYNEENCSLDELLSMFIGMGEPIPETAPPAPREHAQELVGTWLWGMDATYSYEFNADGTGTRGFKDSIEDIEWRTEDSGYLFVYCNLTIESWIYSIEEDVLTIESLQTPGMIYRYNRAM